MSDSLVLGIDIGGSHITAGMVDLRTRTLQDNTFERKKSIQETPQQILSLLGPLQ